jgi:uncharacterized phage protein gp47/JayE
MSKSKKVPKIVIHLEGGLVQWVYGDSPVDVLIMDVDTEGATEDEITKYQDIEGEEGEAVFHFDGSQNINKEKSWVKKLFETVIKDHAKKAEENSNG